jgi:radical SAM superfamily enzyme YgiQ (UPF0313 family)
VRGEIGILDYILAMEELSTYGSVKEFINTKAAESVHFTPDILAFSLIFSTSHAIFAITLDILKALWPEACVVVGGTHATAATRPILENNNVDYVIRGEGEIAFSDFVSQYAHRQNITIKGVYARQHGELTDPLEITDAPVDLDILPYPDWQLVDMKAYSIKKGSQREFGDREPRKVATIVTTRGCPNRCTFCAAHLVHGRKVRYRSVENVVAEVLALHKTFGITLFIPEDDMFTVPKKRFIALMKALRSLNIPGFEMQNQDGLSVNTLDDDVIDAMLGVGVRLFNLAVESGSNDVQTKLINKNVRLHRVREIIDYIRSKNGDAIIRCYFILGFFGETKEQMLETIEFAKGTEADWCLFSIATPLIGTEMHRQMLEAGLIEDNIEFWVRASFGQRCFDTPEISAAELTDLSYRANLEVNFFGNINKQNGNYSKALGIYNDIVRLHPFHIVAWYCIMECYERLNNHQKATETRDKLYTLIHQDARSAEMYSKYRDLMPLITKSDQEVSVA